MIAPLEWGSLQIQTRKETWDLDRLCGFASRNNPLRPFLIVSKVLGKHIPCDPFELVHACDALLASCPPLNQTTCVIGMAETATSLGQTFFERLWQSADCQGVYVQTTRYRLSRPVALTTEESHSHATSHLVYQPTTEQAREAFFGANTLVVVDDEFTTGATAAKLVANYAKSCNNKLGRILLVCLTNWMSDKSVESVTRQIEQDTGVCPEFVSLLSGELNFTRNEKAIIDARHTAVGATASHDTILGGETIRRGITAPPTYDFEALLEGRSLAEEVAVIGTGEYMYPPSLLARWLHERGHRVTLQSTTRSPIAIGGAIESSIEFVDNYGDGIKNYLYNHQPRTQPPNRDIVVCYETSPIDKRHNLPTQLSAITVYPDRTMST